MFFYKFAKQEQNCIKDESTWKSGSSCIYSDQEWHAFSRQGIWLWFYHELLESETWEAKPTYKGFMGYGPGCAVLTDTKTGAETLSGIENRFLPTLLQNLLFADFRGITVLLFEDAFFLQAWIRSFKHVSWKWKKQLSDFCLTAWFSMWTS